MVGTLIRKLAKYDAGLNIRRKGPTIAVSGMSGAGKTTVAKAIARTLKLKLVNTGDLFRQIAKEKHLKLADLSKKAEPELDYELDRRTIKLAKEGNVVLVGRLVGYAAGHYADLKVFVECPLSIRAQRVAKREGTSIAEALKDILKRDSRDFKRYMKLYRIDCTEKRIYDAIINTGQLTKSETEAVAAKLSKFIVRGLD
jgi:cytidylate kinase